LRRRIEREETQTESDPMRSCPCIVVGITDEARRLVREGDRLTLVRGSGNGPAVACFHSGERIGHIPDSKAWVARLLDDGEKHEITVTGFDTDQAGKLAGVEIAVMIEDDKAPGARSIISETGDELRILAMVGTADGRLEPAERGVMEQFAAARASDLGLTPDEGEIAHAVRWARRHAPNMLDVAGIVKRLTKERPEALPIVWEACAIVAEIDGRIAPEEKQSMITLRALFEQGMAKAKK
jgi:tellurite resistance protein